MMILPSAHLGLLFLLALALLGCSTTSDQLGFTKVKYYHLKAEDSRAESMSIDPMLRFERQHNLHGAVTMAEKRDRWGHYYTIFWNGRLGSDPVKVRFEYRQSRTGEQVFTHDQVVTDVRNRNKTTLRVTGEPYHRHGLVVAWQASLWQDGKMLDSTRSFLWK
ncbi:MAG: hypothetical protein ACI8T1_000291 [Verrucomicrobiales bacterium]|jgi:hypothetical protein